MQLIVQDILMTNTPSAAKARHSSSISLCLMCSSYFIFGNLKERKNKYWHRFVSLCALNQSRRAFSVSIPHLFV